MSYLYILSNYSLVHSRPNNKDNHRENARVANPVF